MSDMCIEVVAYQGRKKLYLSKRFLYIDPPSRTGVIPRRLFRCEPVAWDDAQNRARISIVWAVLCIFDGDSIELAREIETTEGAQ